MAGASLLAVYAPSATASATPVPFVDNAPGATTFTAPNSGLYDIVAFGAQGGTSPVGPSPGGLGAEIGGDFMLTAGETLTVAVGGRGEDGILMPIDCGGGSSCGFYYGGGGGGGGSFVVAANATPLIVAGGGGGGGGGGPGQTGTGGQGAVGGDGVNRYGGGVNGSGGETLGAGGGGGFYSFGFSATAQGGADYPTLLGGTGGNGYGGHGGFGGGGGGAGPGGFGAGGHSSAFGGGGGGYSGGAGGGFGLGDGSGSGGGGSFDAGLTNADLILVSGVNGGDGSVTITELSSNLVPEPASIALLGAGLAGLVTLRKRPGRPRVEALPRPGPG